MSAARILVRGARLVDLARGLDREADLYLAEGRIVGIGTAPGAARFEADHQIEGKGLLLCPGLFDLAARVREPGNAYRANLASELRAAVAGGVTAIVCPPDTDPPLDEPGLIEMLRDRARQQSLARLYPLGALTVGLAGTGLVEMVELADAGCIGFSQANEPIADTEILLRAMQYAKTFDFAVWLHPQDPHLGRGGVAHRGAVATRLGLPGIPVVAETVAVNTIVELVRTTGCRVHLCRLSSAEGIDRLRRARSEGLPITADVAVHHLHLTDVDIGFFDPLLRVQPPFRSQRDRDAIRAALADGTIDAICSDHTPVDDDSKLQPFGEAEPGATALELLLPLTLKWAGEARIAVAQALDRVTSKAAAIAGVEFAGLAVGAPADLCLVDPGQPWVVDDRSLASQGRNTPYHGRELVARAVLTLIEGRIVHDARPR
ncbi:MAG: dihydroorotase [Burkholderiaceae bacterium]